jgi:hypothetical protein
MTFLVLLISVDEKIEIGWLVTLVARKPKGKIDMS